MSYKNTENYSYLSKIYDELMCGVEYDLWFELIVKLCKEFNYEQEAKILEIGGGTGTLGKKLSDFGFVYLGSDISLDMAKIAKNKNLNFICADCQNLPFADNFDLAIFLFDGINYLFNITQFTQTFEQVHSVLKSGGLFLFDITTKVNSLKNFYNYRESYAGENYTYIRESYYDKENREQHNDFEIFIKERGNNYRRFSEKHCQKVHSVKSVINSIPLNLFEIIGVWGNFGRKKWNKKSERVHFLLRKK
jgi:SAM-dependent methyltransferase